VNARVAITPPGSTTAGPYSPGVRAGDYLFVSGQIAYGEALRTSGVEEQTARALENVRDVLSAAGLTLADVVKTTSYLDGEADFAKFNSVYATYFEVPRPARTTVRSQLSSLIPGLLVEIDAIAYCGG